MSDEMTSAAKTVRNALAHNDPAGSGAIRHLAAMTAADWRSLDPATRTAADEFIASNLGLQFSARTTRTMLTAAAAVRDAA